MNSTRIGGISHLGPSARAASGTGTGYIGGPQDEAGGAAGMRRLMGDELRDARGFDESIDTDANDAQRDTESPAAVRAQQKARPSV